MTTDTDTDTATVAFTDIVADVIPDAHWKCCRCYPEGSTRPRAICGVPLMGVDPEPGAGMCGDCDRTWEAHFAGHWMEDA
ncbi:hypothetical protein [Streptomyces roseolus]|uniref:hypothetical protein n=1 Tax=Streptomyces roseolus TaxID=67358 RepID=UPI0016799424|nr:hypothetical protein [Streptomyces roseolus]GGR51751.1 hypothetical protein GCM10010282_50850 [Streptomyces roseolus]